MRGPPRASAGSDGAQCEAAGRAEPRGGRRRDAAAEAVRQGRGRGGAFELESRFCFPRAALGAGVGLGGGPEIADGFWGASPNARPVARGAPRAPGPANWRTSP